MTPNDQLLSCCTVVELMSFSIAAAWLDISQPTINLQENLAREFLTFTSQYQNS